MGAREARAQQTDIEHLLSMNEEYTARTGESAYLGPVPAAEGTAYVFNDDVACYTMAGALSHMQDLLEVASA